MVVVAGGVVDLCPVELRETCGYEPRKGLLNVLPIMVVKDAVFGFYGCNN